MKKIIMLGCVLIVSVTSCSEKELSHEEKLKEIVEVYVSEMVQKEPVLDYSIDSLKISIITQKMLLEFEASDEENIAFEKLVEAKGLGEKFQDTKKLVALIEESEGQSSAVDLGLSSMREYKDNADVLVSEAKKMIDNVKDIKVRWKTADSTNVVYYEVFALGTVTSLENVKKSGTFPFHISPDYKIIKEPVDFRE